MDELIERIEELTQLNTELKAANAKLEKQNLELTELAEAEAKLKAELEAMRKLNETVKAELEAMQKEYQERIRCLDKISRSAASVDPAQIEAIAAQAENVKKAADSIGTSAERVKSYVTRHHIFFGVAVGLWIGIGGVTLYNVHAIADKLATLDFPKIAAQINEILYIVSNLSF